ncbi:hypothetical protein [Streptomyces sp. NPDC055681]
MEAIIASAIAVLGTLLGSGITLAVQRRTTEKGHEFTRGEKLRQERLDAYTAYAAALVNYRRCLVHLWICSHEQRPEDPEVLKARSYDLRSSAEEALFRVQMLTDDDSLGQAGAALLAEISDLHRTDSRAELDERRGRTRDGIRRLVKAAKQHL